MNLYLLQAAPIEIKEQVNFFEGIPPALVGSIISATVIILLFLIERVISFNIRKREVSRNWYLKIILEPNLPALSAFFDETSKMLFTAVKELSNAHNGVLHNDYQKMIVEQNSHFKKVKRDFEFSFIYLISSYDHELGVELTNKLGELEDIYTNTTGLNDIQKIDENTLKAEINFLKSSFFTLLYKPLEPGYSAPKKK